MQYALTFLEGIITFASPCLLHMLPVYIMYFAGGDAERKTSKTVKCALGFIIGFTIVFMIMGAFAGLIGGFLIRFEVWVNVVAGAIVVLLGLNYLGVLNIKLLSHSRVGTQVSRPITGFLSALLFGLVFAVMWTPCAGAFLGAALMKAAQQASVLEGMMLLLFYSLGLGLPFFISALLIDKLKSTLDWIKRHYKVINLVSGIFLIVVGILMMTGILNRLIAMRPF